MCRTARRRRGGRTGPTGRARRRSRRAPAGPPAASARPGRAALSQHLPGSSYGRSGWGCESVIAMSRYVTRASKAASKICSLKRGSVALSTASGATRPISSATSALVGGVHPLGPRNGRARRGARRPPAPARARCRPARPPRTPAVAGRSRRTPPPRRRRPTTRTFIGKQCSGAGASRWLESCVCCGDPRGSKTSPRSAPACPVPPAPPRGAPDPRPAARLGNGTLPPHGPAEAAPRRPGGRLRRSSRRPSCCSPRSPAWRWRC